MGSVQDISESQHKQLKAKDREIDLAVRIALTNAYRHLFYPTKDDVKASKGLMHYTLPAQDSSTVKGKSNQQEVILKALRDCGKIRAEAEVDAKPFAPAYILQKVWLKGIDSWSTKSLKEEFSKNLALNLPIDAETPKLRHTIQRGLVEGQWDMKVGERLYIKTDDAPLSPPDNIEFSERMVLYRRGILEPPKPREVELSAQLMPSTDPVKPFLLRWRAKEALKVSLYQDGILIGDDFRPSDDYEGQTAKTTTFQLVADYGNGETASQEAQVTVTNYGTAAPSPSTANDQPEIFDIKPEYLDFQGTPNMVFTRLLDYCGDKKVTGISRLELSVSQLMDYRKLGVALGILSRFGLQIDQTVTVQTGGQFLRLEYQGEYRGFQGFFSTLNNLLNQPDARAEVNLKLIFEFDSAILPTGSELGAIKQGLNRNPVERLDLRAKVVY